MYMNETPLLSLVIYNLYQIIALIYCVESPEVPKICTKALLFPNLESFSADKTPLKKPNLRSKGNRVALVHSFSKHKDSLQTKIKQGIWQKLHATPVDVRLSPHTTE